MALSLGSRKIKGVIKINSETLLFSVIGDPVAHSMSPVMHNRAFAETGYNGVYVALNVKDIKGAMTGIRALGIRGASITIPHKIGIMKYLDEVDETAIKIGAVNTIQSNRGILKGFNSDWTGAMSALEEKTAIAGKEILVIGAGGAARAIGFGIVSKGGRLTIANRTHQKGEKLAADLGGNFISVAEHTKSQWDILINTTPVGMAPNTNVMPVKSAWLEKDMVVMDIVYNPLNTGLLKKARKKGCTIIDGVSMFVFQGAWQFELWTGQKAPLDVMNETVRNALGKMRFTNS